MRTGPTASSRKRSGPLRAGGPGLTSGYAFAPGCSASSGTTGSISFANNKRTESATTLARCTTSSASIRSTPHRPAPEAPGERVAVRCGARPVAESAVGTTGARIRRVRLPRRGGAAVSAPMTTPARTTLFPGGAMRNAAHRHPSAPSTRKDRSRRATHRRSQTITTAPSTPGAAMSSSPDSSLT